MSSRRISLVVVRPLVRRLVACLFMICAGCAVHTAAPPVRPAPVPAAAAAEPGAATAADAGIVLVGKLVTMNDAGDILANARVWLRAGRIEAIARAGESLPAAASAARTIESGGVIYPGLIDIHNHPEYAIYPLLPISRKYRDRYEWRNYDDEYTKRISAPNTLLGNREYYDLGMEVGRYGEYMALAGGTTTLQGGGSGVQQGPGSIAVGKRFFRPYAREACLTRNVETADIERPVTSYVDMGRDARDWRSMREDIQSGPLILHLAEGTSGRMADEFRAIKNSDLLGANLVVIHGVGLNGGHFREMAAVGAKLVWSPLSNFLLYGKTADVAAAKQAGLSISLAPDWAPSGSKSVLAELKVADLVNSRQLGNLFSDRELVEMATRRPAQALGWGGKLGQIGVGYLADLIVVDEQHTDAYRNLVTAHEYHLRLTVVRGEALYGDSALLASVRGGGNGIEQTSTFGGKRGKSIAPDCAGTGLPKMSVATTLARISEALGFDAAYTARTVSAKQIGQDLERCGLPPPGIVVTAADAGKMLSCRFGLPFEKTLPTALTTAEDAEFLRRVVANPNLPAYLKKLPDAYRLP